MKKVVMLLALFLGTSFMMNANTVPTKVATAKEVKANVARKHKKTKKTKKAASTTEAAKPATTTQK